MDQPTHGPCARCNHVPLNVLNGRKLDERKLIATMAAEIYGTFNAGSAKDAVAIACAILVEIDEAVLARRPTKELRAAEERVIAAAEEAYEDHDGPFETSLTTAVLALRAARGGA